MHCRSQTLSWMLTSKTAPAQHLVPFCKSSWRYQAVWLVQSPFPTGSALQTLLVLHDVLALKAHTLQSHNRTLQAADMQAKKDAEVSAPTWELYCRGVSILACVAHLAKLCTVDCAEHPMRHSDITASLCWRAVRPSCPAQSKGVLAHAVKHLLWSKKSCCNSLYHTTTCVNITVTVDKSASMWAGVQAAHVMPI